TPTADHDEDILQKLATDLCLGANSCTGLPPDLLESSALNKFIQQNLHSLLALAPIQVSNCNRADGTESSASCREESEDANQPSSPSAMSSSRSSISAFLANSLPLISTSSLDSTSAAPSAVIVTEQQAKPKHKRHQQKPHHNFLPLSASSEAPATAKTSSPSSQCRRAKALNPPPTVVNNFVNETVIEEAPRRHQNKKDHGHDKRHKHSTDQVGELAVGVTSQTPRRSDGHHHRSHHSKRHESQNPVDGDHDSPVVFYKFLPNDAGSEKERRHSHKVRTRIR
uniref:Zinc_ribbon_2 domain-containing protein n=1 Tax=Mesocestoides corti TaxID=53468 RepID=A0A5K3F9P9_MESCO